jgi:hypothetical protein
MYNKQELYKDSRRVIQWNNEGNLQSGQLTAISD